MSSAAKGTVNLYFFGEINRAAEGDRGERAQNSKAKRFPRLAR